MGLLLVNLWAMGLECHAAPAIYQLDSIPIGTYVFLKQSSCLDLIRSLSSFSRCYTDHEQYIQSSPILQQ